MNLSRRDLAKQVEFDISEHYNCSRLLWDNVPDRSSRIAIYHDSGNFTYEELVAEACRIGSYLINQGISPGERVLLLLDDEPIYPAAIMGVIRAGFVPVLINTLSSRDDITFFAKDSAATVIIVSEEYLTLLRDISNDDELECQVVHADDRPWRTTPSELNEYPAKATDMAFWLYSSGSTGQPKGVVHLHRDAAYVVHTYASKILKINSEDICLSVPKIFFAYGFGNSVLFPMSVGASAVLLSGRPTSDRIFEMISKHKPTLFFALPTVYTSLIQHATNQIDLSCIRLCLSAAEILSVEVAQTWRMRFGHDIVEGLGSTEMLHIYLSNTRKERKYGSAGRIVPGYAARLRETDGSPSTIGQEGGMQIKGLSSSPCYWDRPDKTAETMKGEWIETGDRFTLDEDGYYFFKGRSDDLVKVSGQWVYPLEIELVLNEHHEVKESCVQAISLTDERLTIKAWVSPKPGVRTNSNLSARLKAYSKQMLLPHKYPREIVFMDELPKTGTNKIDRQALKAMT